MLCGPLGLLSDREESTALFLDYIVDVVAIFRAEVLAVASHDPATHLERIFILGVARLQFFAEKMSHLFHFLHVAEAGKFDRPLNNAVIDVVGTDEIQDRPQLPCRICMEFFIAESKPRQNLRYISAEIN